VRIAAAGDGAGVRSAQGSAMARAVRRSSVGAGRTGAQPKEGRMRNLRTGVLAALVAGAIAVPAWAVEAPRYEPDPNVPDTGAMEPAVRGRDVDPNAVGSVGRRRAQPKDTDTETGTRRGTQSGTDQGPPDSADRDTNPMGGNPPNPRY
jgi:hypothetical protein